MNEKVSELCCNIDDMTGEEIGFAVDILLQSGALDVWTTPIYMKKNRPAHLLSCLCTAEEKERFVNLIFKHTRTLGVREKLCERFVLKREIAERETPLGPVRIKIAHLPDGTVREKAEYEQIAAIAKAKDMPLDAVERAIYGKDKTI